MYFRIRTLHLTRANFWRGPRPLLEIHDGRNVPTHGFDPSLLLRDESMARFFGEVLPKHLSLRDITISKSRIQAEYWRLFAENCITSKGSLERLALESTPITPEGCQHLKRMLQREVPLFQLKLQDCGLGADEWRGVCEGISGNPEMHTVALIERHATVRPGALVSLLQAPSAVSRLEVAAAGWSAGAFQEFVLALRPNTALCYLTVRCDRRREIPNLRVVEELLTTYNCTLESVTVHPCADRALLRRLEALLERNQRVRELGDPSHHRQLKRPHHFSSRAVWPRVLEVYSRFPTLLYGFVRKANLEAFASQMGQGWAAAAAGEEKASPVEPAPNQAPSVAQNSAPEQLQPAEKGQRVQPASQGESKKRRLSPAHLRMSPGKILPRP
jgi:hypothetical protein